MPSRIVSKRVRELESQNRALLAVMAALTARNEELESRVQRAGPSFSQMSKPLEQAVAQSVLDEALRRLAERLEQALLPEAMAVVYRYCDSMNRAPVSMRYAMDMDQCVAVLRHETKPVTINESVVARRRA